MYEQALITAGSCPFLRQLPDVTRRFILDSTALQQVLSHTHSLSHTHTHTHTLSLSLTHTLSLSHTHTHTHTHTHINALSLSQWWDELAEVDLEEVGLSLDLLRGPKDSANKDAPPPPPALYILQETPHPAP